jgi:hypothetical protein
VLVNNDWGILVARKTIQRAQSEDFAIMDDGKKVGEVRIKASGLLWKAKGKQSWFGVTIEQFANFAETNGKEQDK